MVTYSCPCGVSYSDEDAPVAEGKMWHHAIHEHSDTIRKMSAQDFTEKIREFRNQADEVAKKA